MIGGNSHLFGEILSHAPLRFDYASPSCVAETPYRGLNNFGAYDKSLPGNKSPKLAIIYPVQVRAFIPNFKQYFVNGYSRYLGLKKWFLMDVDIFDEFPIQYTNKPEDYLHETEDIISKDYEFVFIIIERREISKKIYSLLKSELLANGIPSQFINSDRLKLDRNFEWILMNLAISFYGKIGGTPWVISAEENQDTSPEIVVGVSRAMDRNKNFIIGYTTIYKGNGDFILSKFQAPVSTYSDYENHLNSLITSSIETYREKEGEPHTIICHFHKRTSKTEVEAIAKSLEDATSNAKYALLHLNNYSNYRLFDTSDNTFVPYDGLMVKIGSRQAVLLTTGRDKKTNKPRMGTPVPTEITMDRRSTVEIEYFYDMVKQIYNFSRINWRGLNASTIPVTINYSKLIAKLLANIGDISDWNRILNNGKLTNKAWFL